MIFGLLGLIEFFFLENVSFFKIKFLEKCLIFLYLVANLKMSWRFFFFFLGIWYTQKIKDIYCIIQNMKGTPRE